MASSNINLVHMKNLKNRLSTNIKWVPKVGSMILAQWWVACINFYKVGSSISGFMHD